MLDLSVRLGTLTLKNPVLVAAGTFGYGLEFARAVRIDKLGAIVTKTLTLSARAGNIPPRVVETPSGMLNSVGLQNTGLDSFLNEKLPLLKNHGVPIIVSVLGESASELADIVQRLDASDDVSAIELNLSCPNVTRQETNDKRHVTLISHDARSTAAMVEAARRKTVKPLIAKLSPDVTDLRPIAQAAERSGADALSIGNTFVGMSLDSRARRSRLGSLTGGLSGPAIRPLAVYRVWYTAQAVGIPIIGIGGIVRAEDAIEFLLAGASAIAVGTALFAYPQAPLRVLRGLEMYLEKNHMHSLDDLRGRITH